MRQFNQIDSNLTNALMVLAADLSGRLRLEATEPEIDIGTFMLSRIDDPRLEILLEIDGDEINVVFDSNAPWTRGEAYLIRGIAQANHVRIFSNWRSPTFRASLASSAGQRYRSFPMKVSNQLNSEGVRNESK